MKNLPFLKTITVVKYELAGETIEKWFEGCPFIIFWTIFAHKTNG